MVRGLVRSEHHGVPRGYSVLTLGSYTSTPYRSLCSLPGSPSLHSVTFSPTIPLLPNGRSLLFPRAHSFTLWAQSFPLTHSLPLPHYFHYVPLPRYAQSLHYVPSVHSLQLNFSETKQVTVYPRLTRDFDSRVHGQPSMVG